MNGRIEGLDKPPIALAPGEGRAESTLHRLAIDGRPFFVLRQRGGFADIAYDHGRLLANEIDEGAFPEITSAIARGIDRENETVERIGAIVYRCFSNRVFGNTSKEFRRAVEAVAEGYRDGSRTRQFSRQDVRDAIVAIEVGNLVEGLARRIEIPFVRVGTLIGLLFLALPYIFDEDVSRALKRLRPGSRATNSFSRGLRHMSSPRVKHGFGCTGFCAAGEFTADGRHIHARNFDAQLYNWNAAPVLSLIDETPTNAGWHKYVAFGTAGLIYPGGISGLNDAGLAVSMHQLSTTRYASGFIFGTGDIAPFVEQRVLREARTLDEAADLARATRHFAAWTIFCSDAKSGEGMRIEFNGDKVRLTRSEAPLPQSNHFLHPDLVERQFDAGDGHYTPTFGKWLETHARLALVDDALASAAPEKRIDVDWGMALLAASEDWTLKQLAETAGRTADGFAYRRSFGRVPRKAYGQMTSIVRGDPQRRPGHDEVWMTTGDRQPACHSTYAGWRITWEPFDLAPVADDPLRRAPRPEHSESGAWVDSLEHYVRACMAVTRPRDPDGSVLARDPTEAEQGEALDRAEALLSSAVELAAKDGIVEIPYHYMRARIRREKDDLAGARADWDLLREIWAAQTGAPRDAAAGPAQRRADAPLMHPYEAALVLTLSTATEDMWRGATDWPGRGDRLDQARALLRDLKRDTFGAGEPSHFGLDAWLELVGEIEEKGGREVELPDENFITAE